MSIPKAVRDQAEAADRALDAASKAGVNIPAEQVDTQAPVPATPTATESAAPAPASATPTPPASGEPRAAAVQDDGPVSREVYMDLLHRYKSERGMMGDFRAKIKALEAEIATLKAGGTSPTTAQPAGASDKAPHLRHLSDAERQDFGDEVLDVQARVARGEAEALLERIRTEETAKREQDAQAADNRRRLDVFWSEVEKALPGASQTDEEDPRWWRFCEEQVEPLSGMSYIELARGAVSRGDVQSIVRIFEAFYASVGGVGITGKVAGKLKPRTARATAGHPEPKRNIPESEIRQFYSDVSRGKYVNTPDDARAKEQEYEQAALDGRIIPGA